MTRPGGISSMRSLRGRLARLGLPAALALIALSASPAHALKVVTWNLMKYPNTAHATRQPNFRTVMANLDADVLVVQELMTPAGLDSFQLNVLDVVAPGQWANTGFFTLQTVPEVEGGAVFYKPAKVSITFPATITTSGPRKVFRTTINPVGYTSSSATFRIYSVHFKAGGPGTADSTTRRLEATDLRTTLNAVPAGIQFVFCGDTNLYGAYEGAYIRLTESQADNDGRCLDPLSFMTGNWHTVAGYAPYYTQCPCNVGCLADFSGGGMDDRFDLLMTSVNMANGQGVDAVPGGYFAYGNDGQHYNADINGSGFNNAVGLTIATALRNASDHIPVVMTIQLASKIQAVSLVDFGSAIVGATAQQNLTVTNSAVAPADALDYSFSAPAGFTAPGGSFSAAASVGNPHTLSMSTASAGSKSGTLNVATDAPDSLTKPVLLTGTVLAHAAASLDSSAVVLDDSLDFGVHAPGGFTEHGVRVHNRGFNALQAQLAVTAGVITGGAGRFSIIGDFSPATIAGLGRTWEVHFDDSGATHDSTYEATLTFSSADEALPGAAAQPDLVVHLTARVDGGTTAVLDGPLPSTLAFLPPRPNPVGPATRFAFDLPREADVALDVFDLGGRRLARVARGLLPAGRHELRWEARGEDGRRLPAGLYFARFQTPGLTRTHRFAVLP